MTNPSGAGEQELLERETAPPKRWRNRWRTQLPFRQDSGARILSGVEDWQTGDWPSRELAEQAAAEWIAECVRRNGIDGFRIAIYLGAFPISESEKP